jgi:hypothetical protein
LAVKSFVSICEFRIVSSVEFTLVSLLHEILKRTCKILSAYFGAVLTTSVMFK